MTSWVGSSHSIHESAKFLSLAPCESEDKIFLGVSRDCMIEVSRTFVGGVPST